MATKVPRKLVLVMEMIIMMTIITKLIRKLTLSIGAIDTPVEVVVYVNNLPDDVSLLTRHEYTLSRLSFSYKGRYDCNLHSKGLKWVYHCDVLLRLPSSICIHQ